MICSKTQNYLRMIQCADFERVIKSFPIRSKTLAASTIAHCLSRYFFLTSNYFATSMFYVVYVLPKSNLYLLTIFAMLSLPTSVASPHGIVKYPLNASKSFAYCFKNTVNSDNNAVFTVCFFVYYIEGKYAISYTFTQHIYSKIRY